MKDDFMELKDIDELKKDEARQIGEESGKFIFAGVLILVGIARLAGILTGYTIDNWWALFMLIPIGTMVLELWTEYRQNGRVTENNGLIIPIMILSVIIAIFLFDLSWSIIWPVSFIAIGLSILLKGRG